MKMEGLKVFIIIGMLVLGTTFSWAKTNGYKIVLASYPSFDAAQKGLNALEEKLDNEDFELQKKEDFEFVARASGRAFIIGIEPIGDKQALVQILKRYKRWYPQAYGDKYYGPTKGAVFIHPPVSTEETVPAAAEETAEKSTEEKNVTQNIAPQSVQTSTDTDEEPIKGTAEGNTLLPFIKVVAALIFLMIAVIVIRRVGAKSKRTERKIVSKSVETPQQQEPLPQPQTAVPEDTSSSHPSEPEPVKDDAEPIDEELIKSLAAENSPDIFYRLRENMFFVTLIHELKASADQKESQQCRDLMDEVIRYRKNFKHSSIIDRMEELVELQAFERLSALIDQELPETGKKIKS